MAMMSLGLLQVSIQKDGLIHSSRINNAVRKQEVSIADANPVFVL